MSTISGFGADTNKFFGTLPTNPGSLFSVLPDAAASRGLQSAVRASSLPPEIEPQISKPGNYKAKRAPLA